MKRFDSLLKGKVISTLYFVIAVSMLAYLIMKGDLTPKEISVNSIFMFRAGVESVSYKAIASL